MAPALARLGLSTLLLSLFVLPAMAQGWSETATYRNPRHGFSISYPSQQFAPQEPADNADGRIWISRDGNARLLAGALPNADNMSLRDYRDFLLNQSYPGAVVDYSPVRENWFVLSGTREGLTFYERVTFTCGGRIINSWAMIYPVSDRNVYDRFVEGIARSYRPGGANCG